ncbi:MAG: SDR family NAD(P)-dependent oxidoreductase [Caulobacteraceae bacterium]|nr:MAG: SDR family NAD(P)-dependent oxidoreductase [Caulobacteraceae bacterium]
MARSRQPRDHDRPRRGRVYRPPARGGGRMTHPALQPGHTAVITGAADGIGLAAARRYLALGLNVVLADIDAEKLLAAVAGLNAGDRAMAVPTDVSNPRAVEALRDATIAQYGVVHVLMNNAGIGGGGSAIERPDRWRALIEVNLFGGINGVQAFGQAMIDGGQPGLIINTGSKQGITTPPGDTAYNVTKAGVKVLTEGLQHTLRNTPGCQVSAHLLVPGYTFTGMTGGGRAEKPAAAWTADQVIDYLIANLEAGVFYVICPDNDVDEALDAARIRWAAEDVAARRPPLSRWHPDYKAAFEAYVREQGS